MEIKKRKLYRGKWAGLSVSFISRAIHHDYRTTLKYLNKRKMALGRNLEAEDLGLFIYEHFKDSLYDRKPKNTSPPFWISSTHLL
jgi:hypothetical protein